MDFKCAPIRLKSNPLDVRSAMNRYKGGTIRGIFFDGARDFTDDDAGLLYRVNLTFRVTYAET